MKQVEAGVFENAKATWKKICVRIMDWKSGMREIVGFLQAYAEKITSRNNNIWKCEGNLQKNMRKNYGFKKGSEGNSRFPTGVCTKITSGKNNITIREDNFNSRKTNTGTYV